MSAKTINEFTAQIHNRNIARPTLYHVSIIPPTTMTSSISQSDLASMWCSQAATPDIQVYTNDNYIENGIKRKYAYDYDFSDLTLNFYIDQDYSIRNFFDKWIKKIVPYQRRFNYPDDYTADKLFLTVINQNDQDTYKYMFNRIYPKMMGPVELNYSSGTQISTFQVSFVYESFDYAQIDPDTNTETATSVVNYTEPPVDASDVDLAAIFSANPPEWAFPPTFLD